MSHDRETPTPLPPPYGPRRPTPLPQRGQAVTPPRRLATGSEVPEDIEREDTGVLALQFQSTMAASGHNADEIVEKLAAKMAEKFGGGNGGRRPDIGGWVRWGVGLLVTVAIAWWGLAELFHDRPTREEVEADAIDLVAPVRSQAEANTRELREQRDAVIEIRGALNSISTSIGDIKDDIKEIKRRRR